MRTKKISTATALTAALALTLTGCSMGAPSGGSQQNTSADSKLTVWVMQGDQSAGTLKADGLACRTADLEVGAGEMTVKNLTCTQESSLDVGMGKLTIDGGSLDGKNEVSCGMGVAEVAVSRPADYGYALESGMGSVTIDDYSHSGMGVELEVNRSAATFYDIECGMGEVTITFN